MNDEHVRQGCSTLAPQHENPDVIQKEMKRKNHQLAIEWNKIQMTKIHYTFYPKSGWMLA